MNRANKIGFIKNSDETKNKHLVSLT